MRDRAYQSAKTPPSPQTPVVTPANPLFQSRPFTTQSSPASAQATPLDVQAKVDHAKRMGHDLSKFAIAPSSPPTSPGTSPIIQPKLTVGAPNDKYEQEADQVAAQVVQQINSPQVQQQSIQRQDVLENGGFLWMASPGESQPPMLGD